MAPSTWRGCPGPNSSQHPRLQSRVVRPWHPLGEGREKCSILALRLKRLISTRGPKIGRWRASATRRLFVQRPDRVNKKDRSLRRRNRGILAPRSPASKWWPDIRSSGSSDCTKVAPHRTKNHPEVQMGGGGRRACFLTSVRRRRLALLRCRSHMHDGRFLHKFNGCSGVA